MMRFATFICLGLLPVACGFHVAHDQPQFPGLHPLTGVAFGDPSGTAVIFLHGDVSSIGPADYL
jgi:hypothetical protein